MSGPRAQARIAPSDKSALIRSGTGVLYANLAALLRQMIHSGQFAAGSTLPSIKDLAREYDVAQVTVMKALAIIADEGLIIRRQGRGTTVSDASARDRLWVRLESNWDSIIHIWEGSRPRILKVLDTIGSPPLTAAEGESAPAYRYMRRVHLTKKLPYAVIDIHLDRRLYLKKPKQFDSHMVIPLLETLPGVEIKVARQTLTIGTADADTAGLLQIPLNSPVGIVRRVLQDQNKTAIYIGEAIYRGDVVRLERILTK